MRPHRQPSSRRSARGTRNVEEDVGEAEGSSRSGRRHVDSDRRHYSTPSSSLPSLPSSSSMSRPPKRESYSQSGSRDTRSNYRGDDVYVPEHNSSSRHPNSRRGEQSWQRGGGAGERWQPSGHGSDATYRDYDSDRRRNYASAGWDRRDYGNDAYHDNHQHRHYDGSYTSNYGYRTSSYGGRNGAYSQSDYLGGYRNGNTSNQASRQDIYGDRRRGYHSSASRLAQGTNNETRRSSNGGGDPPVSDSTTRNLASQLFQHRGNVTRFDPGRNIRKNIPTTHSSLPTKPTTTPSMKEPGPTEAYLKISLEKSERAGSRVEEEGEEDVDLLDANLENLVRKLLVLDLNGTLVYRSPHKRWHERFQASNTTAAGGEEDIYAQFDPSQPRPIRTAYPRPYLKNFRDYLFHPSTKQWLDTMVWSSAQPHSVNDMVVRCFGDQKGELVAIWARDRLGLDQNDYSRKVQTIKDLNKPWDELNSASSETSSHKMNHSAKTTLLLDDSPLKAHLQPYNHLCIKEYDIDMRKHDIDVRELDVARSRLAGVIAGTQDIGDVLKKEVKKKKRGDEADHTEGIDAVAVEQDDSTPLEDLTTSDTRKRKRKEKKENKKKERIEQQVKKLTDESENPSGGGTYDETLLAVIGILDAVKRESNVAAWIRGGGLIKSLIQGVDDDDNAEKTGNEDVSDGSLSSATPLEAGKGSRKKPKLSQEGSTLSPLISAESDAESETERTGVPLEDVPNGVGLEGGAKSGEEQLWFNHAGTMAYWALKGRRVLEAMGIDIVAGVVGSTG